MFTIEKDVPPPSGVGARNKYPFASMDIGDSFLVDIEADENPLLVANRVQTAARAFGLRTATKYTTRRTSKGVRVWRIE